MTGNGQKCSAPTPPREDVDDLIFCGDPQPLVSSR